MIEWHSTAMQQTVCVTRTKPGHYPFAVVTELKMNPYSLEVERRFTSVRPFWFPAIRDGALLMRLCAVI